MIRKRTVGIMRSRVLPAFTAVILTVGTIYTPVYAVDGEADAADEIIMTQVSGGEIPGDSYKIPDANDVIGDPGDDRSELLTEDVDKDDDPGYREAGTDDDPDDETGSVDEILSETEGDIRSTGSDAEMPETNLDPYGYFVLKGYKITGVTDAGKSAAQIVIPEGIKEIGASVFQHCHNLQKITLPGSLEILGGAAFVDCSSLSTVVINARSFEVGNGTGVFKECAISSVTLPDAMTRIPDRLFFQAGFSNYDLIIGKDITEIGNAAFREAVGIRSLTFEKGSRLSIVGDEAFSSASTISKAELPVSLKTIGIDAFRGLDLSEITVPENVETIGEQAFMCNKKLKKIVIRSTKLKSGSSSQSAFMNTSRDGTIPGDGVEVLELAEGLKYIPKGIFRYVRFKNADIVIPRSVTTIGYTAFGNLLGNVRSITFEPVSSVKSIEAQGFHFNNVDYGDVDTRFNVESGSYAEKWLRETGFTNICAPVSLSKTSVTLFFDGKAGRTAAYTGNEIKPEISVKNGSQVISSDHYTVAFRNNRDAGTATVIITAKPDDNVCLGSKEEYFTILGNNMADTGLISVECPGRIDWEGPSEESRAEIAVKNSKTGIYLAEGKDYCLYYSGTSKPGKASVVIIGLGGYEGSRTVNYTIVKPDFRNAQDSGPTGLVCFTPASADLICMYNSKPHIPEVTVWYNGTALEAGADYTVSCKNNINAYTLKESDPGFNPQKAPVVTITGKGNFTGSKSYYFSIKPFRLNVNEWSRNTEITIPAQKYTGKALTPAPVVTVMFDDGEVKVLKAGTDYIKPTRDDYKNNIEISSGKTGDESPQVSIKTKPGSNYICDVTGYFDIAPKDNDLGNKSLFAVGNIADREFTGRTQMLTDEDTEHLVGIRAEKNSPDISSYLTPGVDYMLGYSKDIINAGKVTVKITGMGDYHGSRTVTYKITPKILKDKEALGKLRISMDGYEGTVKYFYTGYAVKPALKVIDPMGESDTDDYELREGRDYKIRLNNNVNVSSEKKADAAITFCGNYAGVKSAGTTSVRAEFEIIECDLSSVAAEIKIDVPAMGIPYNNGKAITPKTEITVDGRYAGRVRINPKAYRLSYSKNIYPGRATVTVTPTKNSGIKGPVTKEFKIIKGDMKDAVISSIKPQTYKGMAITPGITVKYNGKTLKENTDYTVTYSDNDKKGTGKVTVTALDGTYYTGSKTVGFAIK
ncbi:MAG: leucine-rich repeat domain-containing protein [Lachnospiraceae bacterium]|nr:leucine-rich repeat domain-containing protein [Lachnospiraceae bacterium]